jgi:hypothetical protein
LPVTAIEPLMVSAVPDLIIRVFFINMLISFSSLPDIFSAHP